jgi:hypothetical protein
VLRTRPTVDPSAFDVAHTELRERGHLDENGDALTASGVATRDQLVAARTDCLRSLVADWQPEAQPELDPLVRRLAEELEQPPRRAGATTGPAAPTSPMS